MSFLMTLTKKIRVLAHPEFMKRLNDAFAGIMQDVAFQKKVLKDHSELRCEDESDGDILNSAFGERYAEWMEDLEKKGRFFGNQLEIYRGVSVQVESDINFGKIGKYWTWSKEKAANYSDRNTHLPLVLLTARVGLDDIDLKDTLRKLVWSGYSFDESEREISLRSKARIDIVSPVKRQAIV